RVVSTRLPRLFGIETVYRELRKLANRIGIATTPVSGWRLSFKTPKDAGHHLGVMESALLGDLSKRERSLRQHLLHALNPDPANLGTGRSAEGGLETLLENPPRNANVAKQILHGNCPMGICGNETNCFEKYR